jgi:hypothetical protein
MKKQIKIIQKVFKLVHKLTTLRLIESLINNI